MFSQAQSKEDDFSKLNLEELKQKLKVAQEVARNSRISANLDYSDLDVVKLAPHKSLAMKLAIYYHQQVKKIESEIQNRSSQVVPDYRLGHSSNS